MANHAEPGAMTGAGSDTVTHENTGPQDQAGTRDHTVTQEAATMYSGSTGHNELTSRTGAAVLGPHPSYHGRRVSWVAVGMMTVGFLVGGLALIFGSHGPTWWLFWVGAGITAVGLLTSIATNTFEDWY